MITKIHPHPCLDHLIEYYWIEKNGSSSVRVLPDGSTSIIFNIGGEIRITDSNGNKKTYTDNLIIGAQKKYIVLQTIKQTNIIGIKFKQGEAFHFFNIPMAQFTDGIANLSDVLTDENNTLGKGLINASTEDEVARILDYYFFINVEAQTSASVVVKSVINKVQASESPVLIKDICETENISNKHLISLFNKKVGLSPKLLYRINKFTKVIELLQVKTNVNWPQIAYECNYYDQAHLINEFKNFSGLLPSEYYKNKNAIGLRVLLS
ncbi:MAG: helix-turn-helix domain-containing protein [Bacteroidota bacterium]